MEEDEFALKTPVNEGELRDFARNITKIVAKVKEKDAKSEVKWLQGVIIPILDTANLPLIAPTHRTAASNALCAIVEKGQTSGNAYVHDALLDDSIWPRLFDFYLKRSNDAKGKSMRQLLIAITSVISNKSDPKASELRTRAAITFLSVICKRQDRIQVKPALQGLAYFLQRDVVYLPQLVDCYIGLDLKPSFEETKLTQYQRTLKAFLAWAVHHDTALSAGHLVKNFLLRARGLRHLPGDEKGDVIFPIWTTPVLQMLCEWPDRIQEFQTHVFPHCFTPHIEEFVFFLSYLHFNNHVHIKSAVPSTLKIFEGIPTEICESQEFGFLLAAIETGKKLTIIRESDSRTCSDISIRDQAVHIPDEIFGDWMSHCEPEVRLAGMFLSVYSTLVTKKINGRTLQSLKHNLIHLHTDTDTNFRREVQGYTQKLFDRLRASTATLSKRKQTDMGLNRVRLAIPNKCLNIDLVSRNSRPIDPLLEALAFVVWYLRFLEWEMRPTSSYQRRITALRSLVIVFRSGVDPEISFTQLSKPAQGQLTWAYGVAVTNSKLVRVLFDQILDPFDDIRDAAVVALRLCLAASPESMKIAILEATPRFISRAETVMLQTGRADHADGVARAYALAFASIIGIETNTSREPFTSKLSLFGHLEKELELTLALVASDLSKAIEGRPIHGTFAALAYIVDQEDFYTNILNLSEKQRHIWLELHANILCNIKSLWKRIRHVLCDDAPEGFVPDGLDEPGLDTKEILSYSWRGLKEASNLVRVIISRCPIGSQGGDLMSLGQFETLGRLCFDQLLALRHRGAFSSVSQTFSAFCSRCISSDIPFLRSLPETWYKETLQSIQDKADAITRRSAGIPALISAILAADTQANGTLFDRAMDYLFTEATIEGKNMKIEDSRLPQVHALNCIREIFTSSRLTEVSEIYLGQGLELATRILNSDIWPIRNCSLMLFKALIERLLGSDEAQDWIDRDRTKTSRFSYQDYPNLIPILSNLLNPEGRIKLSNEAISRNSSPFDLHGAEGVFPALQILRQAKPLEPHLTPILKSVEILLSSPHWHLRDMAARTVVSLHDTSQLCEAGVLLLRKSSPSQNTQHGCLLTTKYMFRKLFNRTGNLDIHQLEIILQTLVEVCEQWYTTNSCLFVRSVFLDILGQFGMNLLQRPDSSDLKSSWGRFVQQILAKSQWNSYSKGEALLQTSFFHLFILFQVTEHNYLTLGAVTGKSLGDSLQRVDTNDHDLYCAILESLDSVLCLPHTKDFDCALLNIMYYIQQTIRNNEDVEILAKAQAVLADALADKNRRTRFFSHATAEDIMAILVKLEAVCLHGSPYSMQSAVHLLGYYSDFAFGKYPEQRPLFLDTIARFVRILRMTIIDTNPFEMRFAAVEALNALNSIWTMAPSLLPTTPILLAFIVLLYDLLNDDDNDIRTLAASTSTKLLQAQGNTKLQGTVPILTTHHLAQFLCTSFVGSAYLTKTALRRLMDTPSPASLFSVPFTETFAKASFIDTSLFAVEKQNLYKDDALDAVFWSRILLRLEPQHVPARLRTGLEEWVHDGLRFFTQKAQQGDGVLGWTSKDDVFALGIRVFCAAEVVLEWSCRSRLDRHEVLFALRRFADTCEDRDVHPLWKERVEKVLEKQILQSVSLTAKSVQNMGSRLG